MVDGVGALVDRVWGGTHEGWGGSRRNNYKEKLKGEREWAGGCEGGWGKAWGKHHMGEGGQEMGEPEI